jgi:hypothetical protein
MTMRFAAAALLWFAATAALAQGTAVQRVCPLDGERFSYQDPPPLKSRETYLDQRPVDPTGTWPHAKCPTSGLVLYKSSFSESEIAKLRDFVRSEQYQAMSKVHATHYLEALLRRQLGESPYAVAWALVQATWEVSSDPVRYKQYAEEALALYDSIPLDSLKEIRFRILKRMISGELARRLGRFDSARERFLEMRDSAELAKPFYQRIVELQLKLVRARDSGPHRIPY